VPQNIAVEDAQGAQVFASVMAATVGKRPAVFRFISVAREGFDKFYAVYNELLRGISFENPLGCRNGRLDEPTAPNTANNPAANPAAVFFDSVAVKASQGARLRPGIVSGQLFGADGMPWRLPAARVTVLFCGTRFGVRCRR
jgi:hypothetical protein